jgi:hypothetical protein
MEYGAGLHNWTAVLSSPGQYPWNVTCSGEGYETASADSIITVRGTRETSKSGYCTAEYAQRGANNIEGYVQRGDIVNLHCQPPAVIGEDETVTITIIPRNGMPVKKTIVVPEVIRTENEVLYP